MYFRKELIFTKKKLKLKTKKKTIVTILSLVLGIGLITPFYINAKADEYKCLYSGGTGASSQSKVITCDKDNPAKTINATDGTTLTFISSYKEGDGSSAEKQANAVLANTNTTNDSTDEEMDMEILEALYGEKDAENHKDLIPEFSIWDPINTGAACISWTIFKLILKTNNICSDFFDFDNGGLTWAGLVPIPSFKNSVMKGFVYLLSWIAQIMLAIGILLSIGEETIRYGNGQGNFASTVINFIKAVAFTVIFIIFGCTMFQVANNLGYQGALAIMGGDKSTFTGDANVKNVISTGLSGAGLLLGAGSSILALGGGGLICLTVAVVGFILWLKTVFFYMKKIPQMVAMLGKGSVLPFFISRGQTQAVTSYLQQLGMFYLQIVLQFAFVAFGMNIMGGGASGTENALTSACLGAIMILSIDEIDRWIGGLSGEDDLNKAVSFLHHAGLQNMASGIQSAGHGIKSALTGTGAGVVGEVGDAV